MNKDDKPKDVLTVGGASPILKELYPDKKKKTNFKDKRRYSKIRSAIKKQKKQSIPS